MSGTGRSGSKGKARSAGTSQKRLPQKAKVHRSGRKGGSGRAGAVLKPILVAAVVIGALLAIGHWAQDKQPTQARPDVSAGSSKVEAPPVNPAPATNSTGKTDPKSGTTAGATTPKDPLTAQRAHIDRSGGAKETMLVTAYYADGVKNGESLQPVQILLPKSAGVARAVAEQVVQAPENLQLYSNVPKGTTVKSVDIDGTTATVEVSAQVSSIQGSAAVNNLMASFVYSLTELPNIKSVMLLVNGKPAQLHEIDWAKPITRSEMDARNYFKVEPVIKYVP
ncbi:MAG: GerMN domain-containing protein [Mycobacterium leprae]